MFFDDFFKENTNICVEGHHLKDAILFKIDMAALSKGDHEIIKKEIDIYRKFPENVETDSKVHHCTYGEAGSFILPRSLPPYPNTIIQINDDPTASPRLFWFIDRPNRNDNIFNAFTFIDLNNHLKGFVDRTYGTIYLTDAIYRIDYYQNKTDYTIDFMETYLKTIDGAPVPYKYDEKSIYFLFMYMGLKILSILNCSNIIVIPNIPSPALQKSRKRKNKLPLFSYYTLNINLTENKKNNLSKELHQYTNRIHLCRGHFKKRKTGLFWWQAHVRGQNTSGIIMKDYQLIHKAK